MKTNMWNPCSKQDIKDWFELEKERKEENLSYNTQKHAEVGIYLTEPFFATSWELLTPRCEGKKLLWSVFCRNGAKELVISPPWLWKLFAYFTFQMHPVKHQSYLRFLQESFYQLYSVPSSSAHCCVKPRQTHYCPLWPHWKRVHLFCFAQWCFLWKAHCLYRL